MNSLVQYDSSDDEDDGLTSRQSNQPISDSATSVAPNDYSVAAGNTLSLPQPLLGPTKEINGSEPYPEYEDEDTHREDQMPMSERDILRFLTQPTHPMASMPPSPPGSPNPETSRKFSRFLELKAKGMHFNEDLANKNAFKNPSLLATMMERVGVDGATQYLSSLPKDIFDATAFPSYAYKEELNRSQQYLRNKDASGRQALSAAGKRTIEFTTAGSTEASSRASTPGSLSKRKKG